MFVLLNQATILGYCWDNSNCSNCPWSCRKIRCSSNEDKHVLAMNLVWIAFILQMVSFRETLIVVQHIAEYGPMTNRFL